MKIFITGIAGMLGANIAYLLNEKYVISGADLIKVNMNNVKTYDFDMLDYENLKKILCTERPDIILHTAAAVNVDKCETDIEYAENLNVILTKYLCEIASQIKAKIVYISTDAVYSGEDTKLYSENMQVNPINVYGRTKLCGEHLVLQDTDNLVLRTNIYGYNLQNKYSFGEWIINALANGETLNMFTDIDFSPILVNDLTEIIDMSISKKLNGIYNVCATGCITKYEFGCYLQNVFGYKKGVINQALSIEHNFVAKRSLHMGMDNSKIRMLLNCNIKTPIQSIDYFYELYQKNYQKKIKAFGGIEDGNKDR